MTDAQPCPACGQPNTSRRITCKRCGVNLHEARVAAAASARNAEHANLIDCPDCGHRVSRRAGACPNCGAPITEAIVAAWDEKLRQHAERRAEAEARARD